MHEVSPPPPKEKKLPGQKRSQKQSFFILCSIGDSVKDVEHPSTPGDTRSLAPPPPAREKRKSDTLEKGSFYEKVSTKIEGGYSLRVS